MFDLLVLWPECARTKKVGYRWQPASPYWLAGELTGKHPPGLAYDHHTHPGFTPVFTDTYEKADQGHE
ncbi:hypothetical protein, partial [Stenotrophomonas maltophilia]|uniref:hypothetical protein n=1 Tax=Stenotrophomonas maltophilia TaxID=40324 RepID=UPI001FA71B09